ncbi:redoxin domain-containing protein [Aurantimonas aggregata]|uniref:Redoxin domain-containing protein n=2 Tax=Aurantimonas aggregata TaxID=2047720 RepID=A0A6L9MLX6_9HYPH|nr:SCO family protein [Aurantimonas aggregata]NDV88847.1 redoxin domain-containing protein [Aurantimonas aggregata]
MLWSLLAGVTVLLAFALTGLVDLRSGIGPVKYVTTGVSTIGAEFALVDQDGAARTWSSFRGKPVAVFFGFTNCPDICPTTLAELSLLLEGMGPESDNLTVVLVSGDPKRDTPAVLKEYLTSFDPRITALTGEEGQIDAAFSAFKAYRKVVPLERDEYTVDHSAGVYLYDREGAFVGTLDMHEPQEVRMEKLERLVSV